MSPSEKEEKAGQEVRGAGCQDSESLDKAYSLQDVKAAATDFQAGSSILLAPYLSPQLQGGESHTVGSITLRVVVENTL